MILATAFVPKLFDHKYELPPLAVLVTVVVVQVKFAEPVILAVGIGLTVTVTGVRVLSQPPITQDT